MWFRAGSFPDDRFSVSTLKKRMRRKIKSEDKSAPEKSSGSGDVTDNNAGAGVQTPSASETVADRVENNSHTWPKVVRPPRAYKKSSSKSRLDGGKKATTLPIHDTKTTTSAATIKNSKSNTNLNINTLIKNKLNHKQHVPAGILANNGESSASGAGPYPLVSCKSVRPKQLNIFRSIFIDCLFSFCLLNLALPSAKTGSHCINNARVEPTHKMFGKPRKKRHTGKQFPFPVRR